MNIFIYSDESGVLDKVHNDFFVFGGIIFLDKQCKDVCARKYSHAEKIIRDKSSYNRSKELKACRITNYEKGKLYRSLNQYYKFGIVVNQKKVLDRIFLSTKDKQRYLDYVYKIGVKRCLENLIKLKIIDKSKVENMYFHVDEHTTATNGCYELREALEQEFKHGTYNYDYSKVFPPLFDNLNHIELKFENSASNYLIRAADIIANRVYHQASNNILKQDEKLFIVSQP